jgi:putative peptide zinc metalloprotease protein
MVVPGSEDGEALDVWDVLDERTDPGQERPRLAPDVELKEFHLRWGNDYSVARNPRDLVHYNLTPDETRLVKLMDGSRTVRELVIDQMEGSGELELDSVAGLVADLNRGGFLEKPYADVPALVQEHLHPTSTVRAKLRGFAKTLSIEWSGAERLVRGIYDKVLRYAFTTPFTVISAAVVLGGFVAFILTERSGRFGLLGRSSTADSLILIGMGYVLTFCHELGHALVLVHEDRRIKNAGFMVYFGSPTFFVDASDGLVLDPMKRVLQAAAGPYAELIVAGAAALAVAVFPNSPAASVLYKFCLLNYFVCFLNLIPLLELDGYFILSDLIQVPDLRPRSLEFLQHESIQKLRSHTRWSPQETGLFAYAVVGVLFTILSLVTGVIFWWAIFGGLLKGLWNGGFVGKLLLLLLIVVIAGPALRGITKLWNSISRRARRIYRRVSFRLERSWRIQAAELIDSLGIFDDLPGEVLSEFAGEVKLEEVPSGKIVVRQGELADSFYVIASGAVQAIEEHEDGTERPIRTMGPGESFGELALAEAAPRSATIRAIQDSRLFRIDKPTFDRLLSDSIHLPEFAATVQQTNQLRSLPVFSRLEPEDLAKLLDNGAWENVPPGEEIVREGEEGDSFFAVGSGRFEVTNREAGHLRTLGPGDHFGEIALLMSVPRTATVTSMTPGRVFRLSREGFSSLVADAFSSGKVASWASTRVINDRTGRREG